MGEYVRNPKGKLESRWGAGEEDQEDFEQEQLIKEWLEREGRAGDVEFQYISRKGTARNTIDKRSVRLDAQVSYEGGSRTYADLIAGSDGRDWECRLDLGENDDEPATATDLLNREINNFCETLGLDGGIEKWIRESLKLSLTTLSFSQQMSEDLLLETLMTDLELDPL